MNSSYSPIPKVELKLNSEDLSYKSVQERFTSSPVENQSFSDIAKNEGFIRAMLRGVSFQVTEPPIALPKGTSSSSLASESSSRPDSPTVRKGGEEFLRQMAMVVEHSIKEDLISAFRIYGVELSENNNQKISDMIYEFAFDKTENHSVVFTPDEQFIEDLILQIDDYREDYEPCMNQVEILALRDVVQIDATLYLPLMDSFSKIGNELKAFSDFLSRVSRERKNDDVSAANYEFKLSDIEEAKLSKLMAKLRHRRNKEQNSIRRRLRGNGSLDAFSPGL